MELSEELLYVIAKGNVFPRIIAIDEIPYPRRQIAGRFFGSSVDELMSSYSVT